MSCYANMTGAAYHLVLLLGESWIYSSKNIHTIPKKGIGDQRRRNNIRAKQTSIQPVQTKPLNLSF